VLEYVEKHHEDPKMPENTADSSALDLHFTAHVTHNNGQDNQVVMKARVCLPRVSLRT
jgi:hypothetical protein